MGQSQQYFSGWVKGGQCIVTASIQKLKRSMFDLMFVGQQPENLMAGPNLSAG
jgi:hypothetical protein